MTKVLVLAEKPSSAQKIADALSGGSAVKKSSSGKVPYYEFELEGKEFVVVPAVGHLFSLAEKTKSHTYPVFEVEWRPSAEVNESASFSRSYLENIKRQAKGADEFIASTDYDLEGEVIAGNALEFAVGQNPGQVKRMRFSTLTTEELVDAFHNASPSMDLKLLEAGRTRHRLDFYWGISLSRALMSAIKAGGRFKVMSVGRVQGPALAVLAKREKEITAFISSPYWQLFAIVKQIVFENVRFRRMKQQFDSLKFKQAELRQELEAQKISVFGNKSPEERETIVKTLEKNLADVVLQLNEVAEKVGSEKIAEEALANSSKEGVVESVERKKYNQMPPFPFDLTTLQTEAHSHFGFTPTQTLDLAQNLYEQAVISYPRTSSQKLPAKLNLPKILQKLSSQQSYSALAGKLISQKLFSPHEGKKEDPAHPAIFPTGERPSALSPQQAKVYDLIVRRFLACFAPAAVRERLSVLLLLGSEKYSASGSHTIEGNWIEFYSPYARFEEVTLPDFKQGERVLADKIWKEKKMTQPPKRFSEASLLRKLEEENLGTKATRATIIKTLFDRGYVSGKSIEVTPFGMTVYDALAKEVPQILSEELTRHIEQDIEAIQAGSRKSTEVIEESRETLSKLCEEFKGKEKAVGLQLLSAFNETQREQGTLGECNLCKKGKLVIRKGKFGMFVGCNAYPACRNTFPLPKGAAVKASGKACEKCGTPIVWIRRRGKRPFSMCLMPNCESKKEWAKNNFSGKQEKEGETN